jgi:serine/threonine protein kinase
MPTIATTTECPPLDALMRLLKAKCDESQASPLCGHIENCPACQEKLDQLSGDGTDLATDLRALSGEAPATNSVLRGALKRAEHEITSTAIGPVPAGALAVTAAVPDAPLSGTDKSDAPDLSFLLPSKVPGNLGRFGPFEVRGVVGRGGMGVVLRGYDESLNREVAIKVIDPQLANNKQYRERFVREARAAAAVAHANLVAVYQVSDDAASGLPYIVMQLVNGESLDQRLKRTGKLIPKKVAWLGMQVAAGLDAAHKAGLTHRDIKPGNILLERVADPDAPAPAPTGSGTAPAAHDKFRVKLTDFGLAKAADDSRLTRTGFVAGSPLYMAPEQAAGGAVDQRADLFSLGTLLYEAATGRAPFDAGTPLAVLRRLSDETQMPLSRVNPDVPKWLSDAVDKLLAKNADDRFQSAREVVELFAGKLHEMGGLSPLDVPPDVCPAAYLKARGRKPICWRNVGRCVMPWAGGAVLGAVLIGLLWALVPGGETPPPNAQVAEAGPEPRHILKGENGAVWSLAFLSDDRLAAGIEDGTVRIWNHRTGAVLRTFERSHEGNVWAMDVSNDGKYMVFACDNTKVTFWNLQSLRPEGRFEFTHPASMRAAAFSPVGRFLATGDRASTLRVWDWENQIPMELTGHRGAIHSLAFSPDGKRLASTGSDGSIKEWELRLIDWNRFEPLKASMEMTDHRGPVYGVTFSPDGTKLASAGWDGTVRIWDAMNGTLLKTIAAHDGDVWAVSYGGGGRWVASAGSDAHVKVWDVETGKEVWGYRGPRGFHVVKFGPDGTTLAAGSRSGNVKVWDVK